MSTVSNYILTASLSEEGPDDSFSAINDLNRILDPDASGQRDSVFVRVSHLAGGYEAMECDVWLLATNCVSHDEIATAMRKVSWQEPGTVQLFVKHQDEERFWEVPWRNDGGP